MNKLPLFLVLAFIAACTGESSPTFELSRSEWVCTVDVPTRSTMTQLVGKVVVTTPITGRECVRYERRKAPAP